MGSLYLELAFGYQNFTDDITVIISPDSSSGREFKPPFGLFRLTRVKVSDHPVERIKYPEWLVIIHHITDVPKFPYSLDTIAPRFLLTIYIFAAKYKSS